MFTGKSSPQTKTHNRGYTLDKLIDGLEPGVGRAVLQIVGFHQGRDAAISRESLLDKIGQLGFTPGERELRAAIAQLRKAGFPICATGGKNGGYWWAANWSELLTFCDVELDSRALDMLETSKAMKDAGERYWGPRSLQQTLFPIPEAESDEL